MYFHQLISPSPSWKALHALRMSESAVLAGQGSALSKASANSVGVKAGKAIL